MLFKTNFIKATYMSEERKEEKKLVKKLVEKAKDEAHREKISLDDHGDTIVGNRLSKPNFDFEAEEEKKGE